LIGDASAWASAAVVGGSCAPVFCSQTEIVKRVGENHIQGRRINLARRADPILALFFVTVFELPGSMRVVERGRIAGVFELIHQTLRLALFALEQERDKDLCI
jgi:hypothetical protein